MNEYVDLTAADGHQLSAYVAHPESEPVAGLVVVQEVFGINRHIRSVADSYARDGFLAVAPALFDRFEPGVELDYEGADRERAMTYARMLDPQKALADIEAAMNFARSATGKQVGVIGYCFGGLMAWVAAARLNPAAAVGYYAGRIGDYAAESPTAPVMLHFGKQDMHIPAADVEKVHAAHPEVEIHWYDAGHGFNCDARTSYNPAAAQQARARSLSFLKQHLG